jgi:hypothetical protein
VLGESEVKARACAVLCYAVSINAGWGRRYMKALIAEFGTDHFYQADGFFNAAKGPWLADDDAAVVPRVQGQEGQQAQQLPACRFSDAINDTYVAGCTDGNGKCVFFHTLAEAETACVATANCGGVVYQTSDNRNCGMPSHGGCYSMRAANVTTPSPGHEPSTSWLIINAAECHPPPPPPAPPPPPDAMAAAHSAAAYAGMARTDPESVWVYQTWIWRGFKPESLPYLKGWLSSIPAGKSLLLDQTAEWTPIWKFFDDWSFDGGDFVWCTMSAMGGNLGLFGDFEQLNAGPVNALAQNASIAGVGIDPEGIDNNPAYYSFMLESAWRSKQVNVSEWLQSWGVQRCGRDLPKVRQAWALLARTVYADSKAAIYEHHMACKSRVVSTLETI